MNIVHDEQQKWVDSAKVANDDFERIFYTLINVIKRRQVNVV
jgi:hypothetical protein